MSVYLNEEQIRELIYAVKSNPILYKKTSSAYKDTQQKSETWNTLVSTLSFAIDADKAAAKFKNLRDSFTRENKKASEINPGRSGQGVVDGPPDYKSSWPYFNDLLFLRDHVTPRSDTCTSYIRPSARGRPSSSGRGSHAHSAARSSSSTGTPDSGSREDISRSSTPLSAVASDYETGIMDASTASESEEISSLRQKALHYQANTPPPDTKRRRRTNSSSTSSKDSEFDSRISNLESMGKMMMEKSQAPDGLSSIKFALQFVHKEMQLQCVMDMMAVAQRYSRMSLEEFYSIDRNRNSPHLTSPHHIASPHHTASPHHIASPHHTTSPSYLNENSQQNVFFPENDIFRTPETPASTQAISQPFTMPVPIVSKPHPTPQQKTASPCPPSTLPQRIIVSSRSQPNLSLPSSTPSANFVSLQRSRQSSVSQPVIATAVQSSQVSLPRPLSQQNIIIPGPTKKIVRISAAAFSSLSKINNYSSSAPGKS